MAVLVILVDGRDAADAAFANRDAATAEPLLATAYQRAAVTFGANHPDTIDILRTSGDLREQGGDVKGAIQAYDQAAAAVAKGLGANSGLGLDIAVASAQLRVRAGLFRDGSAQLKAACASLAVTYGQLHPKTADCNVALGTILSQAGDLAGAAAAFRAVRDIAVGLHGADDPDAIRASADLAENSRLAGRASEAVQALEALRGNAKVKGDPELGADINSLLARAYEDVGRFGDALALNKAVYTYRRQVVGDTDPNTLGALNFVAGTLARMGNLTGAETAYRQALAGYQATLGTDDLATITVMNNLGVLLEQEGLFDEAEPLLRDALDKGQNVLGPGHPTTLRTMNNLALLYESQGNFDRAESMYLVPLQVLDKTLGVNHPDAVAITNNLAFLYMLQENYPKAATMFERSTGEFAAGA